MAKEGNWRSWTGLLVYRRPYDDTWGVLHDPTTEWDALLKNHKPGIMFLLVGEGSRQMTRPASVGAQEVIRCEQQERRQQEAARINALEADFLERTNRSKQWKRRQRAKQSTAKQPHVER